MKHLLTLMLISMLLVGFAAKTYGPDYVERATIKRLQGEQLSWQESVAIKLLAPNKTAK